MYFDSEDGLVKNGEQAKIVSFMLICRCISMRILVIIRSLFNIASGIRTIYSRILVGCSSLRKLGFLMRKELSILRMTLGLLKIRLRFMRPKGKSSILITVTVNMKLLKN